MSSRTNEWHQTLHQVGLRVTKPRLAVLDLLRAAGGPVSHAEVVDALGQQDWDRATLFRNLNDLSAAGLVRRFDVGDHVWRFELSHPADASHAHFVCKDCGAVQCLDDIEIVSRATDPRLLQRATDIQIRGSCDECC
jgi:Fur family ferric uptake transcriptional regulator